MSGIVEKKVVKEKQLFSSEHMSKRERGRERERKQESKVITIVMTTGQEGKKGPQRRELFLFFFSLEF